MPTQTQLDDMAVSIELTVISLVQGLALTELAVNASPLIMPPDYRTWPYILTALLLILFFWAQSIMHALTFVRWPLNVWHNSLYFLAAFFEVVLFHQLSHSTSWFLMTLPLFVIAWFIYLIDLHMLRQAKAYYNRTPHSRKLFLLMQRDQYMGLFGFVPLGLIYSFVAYGLHLVWPGIFITRQYHVWLGGAQLVMGGFIVWLLLKQFQQRTRKMAQES